DNGVGIAPDKIEASFQPFEQVGDVRRRSSGTGLGLSISRQLIRVMGSDIQVRSAIGQGTCFWFDLVLPLGAASLPAPPAARIVVGYGGPVKRVLVVDDVAENRALIGSFLLPLGFEITEAENGQQALEQALAARPDLVLMDMFMPMMDGTQAIRNMRSEPALAAVPIISVSAIAASSDRARSLAAGANAFLPKPIDFDALTAEIGQLLGLSWVFDEAAALTRRC
ncbi:MAG TPA: response regulator, partial [Ideonella sp.]|nr:response regulator [Ideonella sp.]